MSIQVTIDELPAAIDKQIGWCYLLNVAETGQPRLAAVIPRWTAEGELRVKVGERTATNIAARPNVALVYPPADADGLSLIVDGSVTVDGDLVYLRPTSAVLHRSALQINSD
jgi:hypothetical protein